MMTKYGMVKKIINDHISVGGYVRATPIYSVAKSLGIKRQLVNHVRQMMHISSDGRGLWMWNSRALDNSPYIMVKRFLCGGTRTERDCLEYLRSFGLRRCRIHRNALIKQGAIIKYTKGREVFWQWKPMRRLK